MDDAASSNAKQDKQPLPGSKDAFSGSREKTPAKATAEGALQPRSANRGPSPDSLRAPPSPAGGRGAPPRSIASAATFLASLALHLSRLGNLFSRLREKWLPTATDEGAPQPRSA